MDIRLSYRATAVAGASPLRLVILLYEQAIEDIRRALAAQRRGSIEERTREIDHALLVLGHLQATLDKDQGGSVAANLERFYKQVSAGLVEAQCTQSAAALEQQMAHLMLVHQAWSEVEQRNPSAASDPPPATPAPDGDSRLHADWKA